MDYIAERYGLQIGLKPISRARCSCSVVDISIVDEILFISKELKIKSEYVAVGLERFYYP